jgi:hypothetical protein
MPISNRTVAWTLGILAVVLVVILLMEMIGIMGMGGTMMGANMTGIMGMHGAGLLWMLLAAVINPDPPANQINVV